MFAVGFLVGKVAKVVYITWVLGCAHWLIFILVFALSVVKVAEVAGFMGWRGYTKVSFIFALCF